MTALPCEEITIMQTDSTDSASRNPVGVSVEAFLHSAIAENLSEQFFRCCPSVFFEDSISRLFEFPNLPFVVASERGAFRVHGCFQFGENGCVVITSGESILVIICRSGFNQFNLKKEVEKSQSRRSDVVAIYIERPSSFIHHSTHQPTDINGFFLVCDGRLDRQINPSHVRSFKLLNEHVKYFVLNNEFLQLLIHHFPFLNGHGGQ